ncbi:MAG: hypothetical protein LC740_04970 [Actinobacteria bacterium]|nr:hypothetical protein [Actinomycetota bacterium]
MEIVWLAGKPVKQVIAEAGETLLPESASYGDGKSSAEDAPEAFSLNLISYGRRAQSSWKRTVAIMFEEVGAKYP